MTNKLLEYGLVPGDIPASRPNQPALRSSDEIWQVDVGILGRVTRTASEDQAREMYDRMVASPINYGEVVLTRNRQIVASHVRRHEADIDPVVTEAVRMIRPRLVPLS
jgi:hypothetical protein